MHCGSQPWGGRSAPTGGGAYTAKRGVTYISVSELIITTIKFLFLLILKEPVLVIWRRVVHPQSTPTVARQLQTNVQTRRSSVQVRHHLHCKSKQQGGLTWILRGEAASGLPQCLLVSWAFSRAEIQHYTCCRELTGLV